MTNRKKIIILSVVVILFLIIGGLWFYSRKTVTPGEEKGFLSFFFPSAGEKEIEGLPGAETGLPTGGEIIGKKTEEKKLTQLTSSAVSGATTASTTVRYIEKSTGHIYEINPDGQNRQRLSNTTILKTFESFWSPRANKVIIRYFEEASTVQNSSLAIKTFSAVLGTTTQKIATTTPLQGTFLPSAITAVTVSPDEEKIFYLIPAEEKTRGITANFENKNQKNIFNSSFGEFNINWPKGDTITLLTKPSALAEGFFYSLSPQTGKFGKIIGEIKGLTALLSFDGTKVIYSESNNSSLETKIFNVKENKSSDFDLKTMPEKCVWSKLNKNIVFCAVPDKITSGDYPDDWYQGLISFKDSIWQKDFSTGKTNILIEQTDTDVINPLLNKDESYLIFTNKEDNTLWSLKLK